MRLFLVYTIAFVSTIFFSSTIVRGQEESGIIVEDLVTAQTKDTVPTILSTGDCDISYKGGDKRMKKILMKNIKYPEDAVKDSISGTVYIAFIIDSNGYSTDLKVIKGIREDLDKEAIRCVDLLDEWNVGKQNGRKVKTSFILPIKFSLADKGIK